MKPTDPEIAAASTAPRNRKAIESTDMPVFTGTAERRSDMTRDLAHILNAGQVRVAAVEHRASGFFAGAGQAMVFSVGDRYATQSKADDLRPRRAHRARA